MKSLTGPTPKLFNRVEVRRFRGNVQETDAGLAIRLVGVLVFQETLVVFFESHRAESIKKQGLLPNILRDSLSRIGFVHARTSHAFTLSCKT